MSGVRLTRFKRFAGLVAVCVALAILPSVANAQVQDVLPPVTATLDSNVNVATGEFSLTTTEVAIGDPGAGGLAFGRTWLNTGWRDSLAGTINADANDLVYSVSFGASSETFTHSGGVFTSNQQLGSTLALASGEYIYTTRDGMVMRFASGLRDRGAPFATANFWAANRGLITSLTKPDGEVITWNYNESPGGSLLARRPQSITNNLGYMIHFTYAGDSLAAGGYFERTKATGINRNIFACAFDAFSCNDSQGANWPYATYTQGAVGTAFGQFVTDRLGNVTTYLLANSGPAGMLGVRLPTSPSANSIDISYNTSGTYTGRVSKLTVNGFDRTYAYSGAPVVPLGTYSYTDATSSQGVVTRYRVRNSTGRVEWESGNLAETARRKVYTYDANGRVTRTTGVNGDYTEFVYDSRGNITQTTLSPKTGSGLAIVTSASYPASCANPKTCNKPTSTTDARGYKTDYTYDATHGGVLTVTAPAPTGAAPYGGGARPQTSYAYTSVGGVYRLASVSACATATTCTGTANESVTTLGYTAQAQVASITLRAGDNSVVSASSIAYTPQGDVATVDGPLSGAADTTFSYYDDMRRLRASVSADPDGGGALQHRVSRITYPTSANPMQTLDVGYAASPSSWNSLTILQTSKTTYDAKTVLPIQSELSSGGTIYSRGQVSYNGDNNPSCAVIRMNPAEFGAAPPANACTADTQGSFGPDRMTTISYDAFGVAYQTASGVNTPLSRQDQTAAYDAGYGLTQSLTDARGYLTRYEYDGFNRLTRTYFPNPASPGNYNAGDYTQLTYDQYGRVTSARTRDDQSFTYAYDNLGRVTSVDAPGTQPDVTYAYDLLGRVTQEAQTGNTISRTFDALGRMTSETQAGKTVSYQYDAAGRRIRMTWPDGVYVTYDYNTLGEVTALRENGAASGAGVLATFAYDNLGRRTTLTRGNGSSTSYGYDGASRLTVLANDLAGAANDLTIGLSYNPAHQIVQETLSNAAYNFVQSTAFTDSYAADGLNKYTAIPSATPAYDARGNMTNDGTKTYAYDASNRMTTAGSTSLTYDPSGRLYQVDTIRLLYDGVDMIAEMDTSGAILRRYVHGPGIDEPLVQYDGAGVTTRNHLFADELGSIIAKEGATTSIYKYDEYGVPASGQSDRFQYTGQIWLSEVGLYNYKARFYSPKLGRFMQTDPIGYADGMNLYNYVGSDPINGTDPLGLRCKRQDSDCREQVVVTPRHSREYINSVFDALRPRDVVVITPPIARERVVVTCDENCRIRHEANRRTEELFVNFWADLGSEVFDPDACFGASASALDCTLQLPGIKWFKWADRLCGCFVEGTLVSTPSGLRPIEDIKVGDLVLAWDEDTGEVAAKPVTDLIRPEPKLIWRLEAKDADGETEVFEVTDDHPWYVETLGWVETKDLRAGQRIKTADGRGLEILEIAATDRMERTYNLTVEGLHTFLVGEGGAVVHNSLCGRAAALVARLGRHRVEIRGAGGKLYQYDLAGRAHFDKATQRYLATPHMRVGTPHVGANGRVNYTWEYRAMTEADLRTVNNYLAR